MTDRLGYVYVTYIAATPERVWQALTDADLTAAYWGHSNRSDWQPGSSWRHVRTDGSEIADITGTVLEAVAPQRLVLSFPGADGSTPPSRVTFTIEHQQDVVRLTVRTYGAARQLPRRDRHGQEEVRLDTVAVERLLET